MSKHFLASLTISGILLLSGCGILANPSQPGLITHYSKSTNKYLKDAAEAPNSTERNEHLLEAAGRALQDHHTQEAESILSNINPHTLPTTLYDEKFLLDAQVAINSHNGNKALLMLNQISNPHHLSQQQTIAYYQSASMAHGQTGEIFMAAQDLMTLDPHLQSNKARHNNRLETLNLLIQLPDSVLDRYETQASYGILGGWMEIAYITKRFQGEQDAFHHELDLWRQRYPGHPANELYPNRQTKTKWQLNNKKYIPQNAHIALLLPTTGKLASSAEAIRNGFMANYYNNSANRNIKVYNTNDKDIQTIYSQAIDSGATLVVGPLTRTNVRILQKHGSFPVPTLALNNGDPKTDTKNLFQYALSPNDEARQAAKKAAHDKKFKALVIIPAGNWGQGIEQSFSAAFAQLGGKINQTVTYTPKTNLDNAIKNALDISGSDTRKRDISRVIGDDIASVPRRRQDVDMVFLVASPSVARQIRPLLSYYYAKNLPIYATSMVYSGKINPLKDKDLNDIEFSIMPWLIDKSPGILTAREQMHQLNASDLSTQSQRLYAFGLDAYRIATHLSTLSSGIDGYTGALFLEPNHQIYRQLLWAKYKNGKPVLEKTL